MLRGELKFSMNNCENFHDISQKNFIYYKNVHNFQKIL